MPDAAPQAIAITKAVEAVMRNDRGQLMAALIARLRDFHLAEEALQEAAMSALVHWGRSGLPASPQGWLLRVALRKAIDRLRGAARAGRNAADMARLAGDEADETDPEMIPDERLRLIFTCCHPALDPKSRVALTLRTLGGLSTTEIARAFLDAEPTMGQRLSRAKAKIAAAGIPFAVPGPDDWAERLQSVLAVIYLIFNAGYTSGPIQGRDLCDEAIFLARLIDRLSPLEPEIEGALALLLMTHARRAARIGADGATVPPPEQDRSLWDSAMIAEGRDRLDHAMQRRSPGPYQIKAAIAALNLADGPTDWPQIALLYHRLSQLEPTAVVQLNLCVALDRAGQGPAALALLHALSGDLATYQPYHAARAEILSRHGRADESRAAYDRAIALASNPADAVFLRKRRDRLPPDQASASDRV
jgi:RNA polymerase sigma factor (sigma-70 family)